MREIRAFLQRPSSVEKVLVVCYPAENERYYRGL